jgi:hypothetical protein
VKVGFPAPQEVQTSTILNPTLLEGRLVPDCMPDERTEFDLDGKLNDLWFTLAEQIPASVLQVTSELLLLDCAICTGCVARHSTGRRDQDPLKVTDCS